MSRISRKQGKSSRRGASGWRIATLCALVLLVAAFVPAAGPVVAGLLPMPALFAASAQADEGAIVDESTGASYESLKDAMGSIGDGDVLELRKDATSQGAVSSDKAFTLDLKGHKLVLEGGAQASAGSDNDGAALKLTASGRTIIKDSTGGGLLCVHVGASPENLRTYRNGYQGIYVGGGGTLDLDSCAVEVDYAGTWTIDSAMRFTLTGVGVGTSSSALVSGTSSLDVKGALSDGGHGATAVRGIFAQADAAHIAVDEQAKVTVDSNAATFTDGSPLYPGRSSYNNASLLNDYIELHLNLNDAKQKAIYDEIQELFKRSAKVDATGDKAGYVSGCNVYYAQDLWLDEQVSVDVTSDQVAESDIGNVGKIKAAHIFVHASSTVAKQEAYGIAATSGFKGDVKQSGEVKASVTRGDAFAVYKSDAGTWTLDEDKLSASADDDTYCLKGGSFDLADYVDITPKQTERITYPLSSNAHEVNEVKSVARPVAVAGTDYQEIVTDGDAGWKMLFPDTPDKVTVDFAGAKNSSGNDVTPAPLTIAYGSTLASSNASAPDASDYTEDGTTYRFIGWTVESSSNTETTYRSDYVNSSLTFDAGLSGAVPDGKVTLTAKYVAVGADEHLVAFDVDGSAYAYAAKTGATPSYLDANPSAPSAKPSSSQVPYGYDYSFHGWYEGATDDNVWSSSRTCLTGSLPSVTADATYTALFDKSPSHEVLTFEYLDSSGSRTTSTNANYDWTTKQETSLAAKIHKAGDRQVIDGVLYTFEGWAPRESDKTPTWTTELPSGYGGTTGFSAASVIYYAVYSTSTFNATVNFYVGDTLYATSADVSSDTTIRDAFLASTRPTNPASNNSEKSFLEWNKSATSKSRLYNNLTTIGEVDSSASPTVNLYATWEQIQHFYTVTFYDSDLKTVLYKADVLKGDTVANSEGSVTAKAKGKIFRGWVTAGGKKVDLNKLKITKDMKLYATYRTLNAGTGPSSGDISLPKGNSGTAAQVNGKIVLPKPDADIAGISGAGADPAGRNGGGKSGSSGSKASSKSDGGKTQVSDTSGNANDGQSMLGNSDVNNTPAVIAGGVLLVILLAAVIRWALGRRDRAEDSNEDVLQLGDMKIRF